MSVLAAENLVNDRTSEFRRLALSAGGLQPPRTSTMPGPSARELRGKAKLLQFGGDVVPEAQDLEVGTAPAGGSGGFMRQFFEAVEEVQVTLRHGRECVQKMDKMLEDVLQATTEEKQRTASDALRDLADAAAGHVTASKRGLDALRARAEKDDRERPSAAEHRIRQNMQQAMARKHQQLLVDFQKAQLDFKQVLERRQAREMQMLCPDATAEEVAQMIEAGETSSQMMMRRMAGAHAAIVEEVQRIRDKHEDIMRLERSIQDLAQMFQEIAVLVDEQGEMLDNIERNVQDTKEYTGSGEKQLDKALKIQHNTRKWQCYLSCFCMLVILVLVWPVLQFFH